MGYSDLQEIADLGRSDAPFDKMQWYCGPLKGRMMPLKIDVRVNDELIERVHIARMNTAGGTAVDTLNDYSVIRGSKELIHRDEPPFNQREFKGEPGWEDWLEPDAEFQHRYGDGPIVCLLKALQKLTPELESGQDVVNAVALTAENAELRKRVAELQAALEAPPF
jgi:hypothetical protein